MSISILQLLDSGNYLTYNRVIAHKLSVNASIMLSELVNRYNFHSKQNSLSVFKKYEGSWFYYTHEKCFERTALSRKEQDSAIKLLESHSLIKKAAIGLPARRHFQLNIEALETFITSSNNVSSLTERDKLGCPKGTNWNDQKGQANKEPNKEPKKEQQQASCCSSLKKELIEALPVSKDEKAYIETKYHSLDDETFKSAVQAYKQYAEKTALDSHYRTSLKALSEKWTANAETKEDKEAKARSEEDLRFERELRVKHLKDYLYSWKIPDIRINQNHPSFFEYQFEGRAITRQLYLSDDFDKVVSELQMRAQDEKRKIDEGKGL